MDAARPPRVCVVLEIQDLVRRFICLMCLMLQRYFGEGRCMAVALSVSCSGLPFYSWLALGDWRSWVRVLKLSVAW